MLTLFKVRNLCSLARILCSLQLAFLSIKVFRFLISVLSCNVNKKLNI